LLAVHGMHSALHNGTTGCAWLLVEMCNTLFEWWWTVWEGIDLGCAMVWTWSKAVEQYNIGVS